MPMSKLIYIDVSKRKKTVIYPQLLFKQKKKLFESLSKTLLFKTEGLTDIFHGFEFVRIYNPFKFCELKRIQRQVFGVDLG